MLGFQHVFTDSHVTFPRLAAIMPRSIFQKVKQKADSSDEEDPRYKKGRFMDTLYKIQEKKKNKDESKWEALKDDFMMNSKMRDWDKQDGSGED